MISNLIVMSIIGPAVAAGACYFVLRFIDDIFTIAQFLGNSTSRGSAGAQRLSLDEVKHATSKQHPSACARPILPRKTVARSGGSAGGLLGLAIIGGITYAILGS